MTPFNTSPTHLLNRSQHHPGARPQRRSPRLLLHSLSPHQRIGLVTPPTHLHNRGPIHRRPIHWGRPPPRQSLRLSLQFLPPHRRDEFQSRREWFQLTTLEPLDYIPAPQRRHWEDNYRYHHLISQRIIEQNRRFAEDNARALLAHLNAYDDASHAPINSDYDSDATIPFAGTSNANNVVNVNNEVDDQSEGNDNGHRKKHVW